MMNPVPWLQMTNMISYQGLVRTFLNGCYVNESILKGVLVLRQVLLLEHIADTVYRANHVKNKEEYKTS